MELIFSEAELECLAKKLLSDFDSKIFLFYGEMGVGKTTLIKELVKALGSEDAVSSPTFSIVNEYASPEGPIYHFDFYRLNSPEEALDFGLEDYLYSGNFIFAEWPEKINNLLPETYLQIELIKQASGKRKTVVKQVRN